MDRIAILRQLGVHYPGGWHPDYDGAPSFEELAECQYAVIVVHVDGGRREHWVFTRDDPEECKELAAQYALSEGDDPVATVDLDTGQATQLNVTHVAVDEAGPMRMPWQSVTKVVVDVVRRETHIYDLDGNLTEAQAREAIESGQHEPVHSKVHGEDIDIKEVTTC